jgi:hypothetical protein
VRVSRIATRVRLSLDRGAVWTALLDDPGRWLPAPATPLDVGTWRSTLGVGPVSHTAAIRLGEAAMVGAACRRSLTWEPIRGDLEQHARNLPDLTGMLAATRGADGLFLELAGDYVPPGGAVGVRLDAVALHRVAESTAQRFVGEIAARLQELVTAR